MKNWIERHQVLAVSIAGALGYLLWVLRAVIIVFFFAYILAAALRPLVDLLGRAMPRILAILFLYAALLASIFGLIVPSALAVSGQAGALVSQLAAYLEYAGNSKIVAMLGLNGSTLPAFIESHALTLTTSATAALTGMVSAVIISIYLLYDWHDLHASLIEKSSAGRALANALKESERTLGSWVRGQLLLSISIGALAFLALLVVGVPFAPTLAVFAGLTEFIPYVGPFIGAAPAILIALNSSLAQAIIVAVAYLVIQELEAHLLVPLIMKHSVQLHPVVVIAVMLAGFELLGIIGVVLAVPFTALVRTGIRYSWHA